MLSSSSGGSAGETSSAKKEPLWKSWKSEDQIARLCLQPGASVLSQNPFYTLMLNPMMFDEDTLKKHYRKLSVAVHPDKNPGNVYAREAFETVNKAYKKLTNEQELTFCLEVAEEARSRISDKLREKREKLRKKSYDKKIKEGIVRVPLPEDDPDVYLRVLHMEIVKVYVEMESIRKRAINVEISEEKRAEQVTKKEKDTRARDREFKKAWEADREIRVDSWRSFKQPSKEKKKRKKRNKSNDTSAALPVLGEEPKKKKKKKKRGAGGMRLPKLKTEQRG